MIVMRQNTERIRTERIGFRREQRDREDQIRLNQQRREDETRREQLERENYLGREQFKDWASQRWWDRKAEVYTQIVEALWRMVSYSEVRVEHYYERMEPEFHAVENARSEEERKLREEVEKKQNQERWKRYSTDTAELRKLPDIGAFVMPEEVPSVLDTYFKRSGEAVDFDPLEQAEMHLEAAKDCLKGVREAAMQDLQLRP